MSRHTTTLVSTATVLIAATEPGVRNAVAQAGIGDGTFLARVPDTGGTLLLGIAMVALAAIIRRH